MGVSGFTIIRNGEKYDFPYLESLKSLLPLCDEVIVAVGRSQDLTRDRIASLNEPKIKIVDTVWDESLRSGGEVLADETNKALAHCTQDWCFYLQADEVLHECDRNKILFAMKQNQDNPDVEGLIFPYLHFYGDYQTVNKNPKTYRYEIRAFKNLAGIYSYRDAQGFRKKPETKLKVVRCEVPIYHYGYVRPPKLLKEKLAFSQSLYHKPGKAPKLLFNDSSYPWMVGLERFDGTHPQVMKDRIDRAHWQYSFNKNILSLNQKFKQYRLFLRYGFEKATGRQLGGYKNYKLIKD